MDMYKAYLIRSYITLKLSQTRTGSQKLSGYLVSAHALIIKSLKKTSYTEFDILIFAYSWNII